MKHHIRSRSTNRQHLYKSGPGAYECRVKDYDGIPASDRDTKKAIDPARIPQYVPTWNKQNPPYISSPTLFTGDNTDCGFDICHELPYRDRSCSVGNKEMHCHSPDPVSASYAEDGKKDCEYKTRVVWYQLEKSGLDIAATPTAIVLFDLFLLNLVEITIIFEFDFFIC